MQSEASVPSRSRPSPAHVHRFLATAAAGGALLLVAGCGSGGEDAGASGQVAADAGSTGTRGASPTADADASASPSPSPSPSASASASSSASASAKAGAGTSAKGTATATGGATRTGTGGTQGATNSAPDFPVPVDVGDATQVITVKAGGSYATVTAWAKGPSGWKAQFSTSAGRVGSNGVTNGATRQQGTYTTPSGTYTITEGFGVQAGGTSMPYHVVGSDDWWVEDPESKFYNSMHGEAGADFPLTEAGDRGSEHLINYPTQYAKALVINYNRWPAVPGRGAGIFLHVNGTGATAGCVSVPRATMDGIMSWIRPAAHPRIAIG
ncbi:L,D-transpeptidase family protein [Streptomyces sp. NPDC000987]|uniref:L,D-transpeptidase family protein n=1 Tax=Streptomyces sp. NPDC000987 TaxID=3154374 RepID=UPI0033283CA0